MCPSPVGQWPIAISLFCGGVKCRLRAVASGIARPRKSLQILERLPRAAFDRGPPLSRSAARAKSHAKERVGRDMPIEDDDRPRKKISHQIGQDLSLLSVEELTERIALLTTEVERLRADISKKRASKEAANSIFKS
jgi:uncharacterized small protein (DUF1192 family)